MHILFVQKCMYETTINKEDNKTKIVCGLDLSPLTILSTNPTKD